MKAPSSLRRTLIAQSVIIGAIIVVLLIALTVLFTSVRRGFESELRAGLTEQQIADEITSAVYGQMLTAYRQVRSPSAENNARFDSLGTIVYERLRGYLFQPMSLESRVHVEAIKDGHALLEVDAHRILDLAARGDTAGARRGVESIEAGVRQLESQMDGFVATRARERATRHTQQLSTLTRWIVVLGLIVVGIVVYALLLLRTIHSEIVQPLGQLSDAADRLGKGDVGARVPEQRHAELASVANSFNEMAVAIHAANAARRESERRYRRLFDEAPVPLYRTSPDGVLLDANPALADTLGFRDASEIIGRSVTPLYAQSQHRREFIRSIESTGAMDAQFVELRRNDGTTIWAIDTARRVTDPETGELSYEGGLIDVTERRRMEDALRDSEERFRQMAEHINEAFFIIDTVTSTTLYVSPTWCEIWGRSLAEAYKPSIWVDAVHADDLAGVAERRQAALQGNSTDAVIRIVRPDESLRWLRTRMFPVRNEAGEVYRIVGVAEDITELKRSEERFTQAQKMEAIGRLAGGVAHDFNNLLTVILSETEMLRSDSRLDVAHSEAIVEIRRAAESAASLTQQLLAFSRKQLVEPVEFRLSDIVVETGKMLSRLIGEDVRLDMRVMSDWMVRADRGQLQQVLTNLAVNARDAMPGGGVLSIETTNVALARADLTAFPDVPGPGEYVVLTVSDTGNGMTPEVRAQIFEPFFTTKELGKGTGLGLATSHGIVKQAGGGIGVYSEPGKGTTFRIYLPRHIAPLPAAETVAAPAPPRGSERILMVEDEPAVRRVGARLLRSQGYEVVEAGDGAEALRVLEQGTNNFDLLFTDVVMPRMGGRELADRVRQVCPGIRVLFTSGYTDDVVLQHQLASQDVVVVHKPYSRLALSEKVRSVLDT